MQPVESSRRLAPDLDDDARRRRPHVVRPMTFDDLTPPGAMVRDVGALIPLESVASGDAQVLAARYPRGAAQPGLELDALEAFPTVRSVVASAQIYARRVLPSVAELLLLAGTPLPEGDTLRNLPSLEALWTAWSLGVGPRRLDVAALPAGLTALGVLHGQVRGGVATLTRFRELARLFVFHCGRQESVAPLAALQELVELRADAPSGWSALRACVALERVVAVQPRLASLRMLRAWTRLRELTLTGGGVESLAGMDAFEDLRTLRLVMLPVDDLEALAGLPRLADVELTGLTRVRDLAPLGRLPALRRLVVSPAGLDAPLRIASVRPLATATALEELSLRRCIIEDADLSTLTELPALRRVTLFGELGAAVDMLRRARPELHIDWQSSVAQPGERVGPVHVRAPSGSIAEWSLREDLTELLGAPTNHDAERRLRRAIAAADAGLLARLEFDTEADAVVVMAAREDDIRAIAGIIAGIAGSRTRAR
jgi:hypothetical protein